LEGKKGKKIGINTYVAIIVFVALKEFFNLFEYTGVLMFSLVVLLSYGVAWATRKFVSKAFEPLIMPFSLQTAFSIVVLTFSLISGIVASALPDLVMMGIGLLWLFMKPGIGPVVLLTVLHAGSILVQIYVVLTGAPIIGGPVNFAILMIFRSAVIYLMIIGLRDYKRNLADAEKLISLDESVEVIT